MTAAYCTNGHPTDGAFAWCPYCGSQVAAPWAQQDTTLDGAPDEPRGRHAVGLQQAAIALRGTVLDGAAGPGVSLGLNKLLVAGAVFAVLLLALLLFAGGGTPA